MSDLDAMRERSRLIDAELQMAFRFFPPCRLDKFLCLEDRVGSGAYGTVFRGHATEEGLRLVWRLEAGRTYAVKRVSFKTGLVSEEIAKSLLGLEVHRHIEFVKLMHAAEASASNIVGFVGVLVEVPWNVYQVMELLRGPDLFDFLASRTTTLPESRAAEIVKHIFTALHYLHRKAGALHRDVKPENFGFAEPVTTADDCTLPTLKMFDLGLAWALPVPITEETAVELIPLPRSGTRLYMAPEAKGGQCGPCSDVWGAGLISYMALSLQLPFGLLQQKGEVETETTMLDFKGRAWREKSQEAKELVASMLTKGPGARVRTSTVLESSWLAHPGTAGPVGREPGDPPLPARSRVTESTVWQSVAMASERL